MSIQIPREEAPFLILSLAGGGEFTRTRRPDGTWRVWLDGELIPEGVDWWLTAYQEAGLIGWLTFGADTHSMLTDAGLWVLKKRHREILGPPRQEPTVDCTDDLPAFAIDPLVEAEFVALDNLHGKDHP